MILDQSDANQEPVACRNSETVKAYAELEAMYPELLDGLRKHDQNREAFLKGRLTVNQFRATMNLPPIPQGNETI